MYFCIGKKAYGHAIHAIMSIPIVPQASKTDATTDIAVNLLRSIRSAAMLSHAQSAVPAGALVLALSANFRISKWKPLANGTRCCGELTPNQNRQRSVYSHDRYSAKAAGTVC